MNIGELKKSLTRFPPDMDDAEVLIVTEDWSTATLLAFTGMVKVEEKILLVLGSPKAVETLNLIQ